ncbi:MAG: 2-oxoacid:acceptor oxidoreductase subunit alpha [Candidatus Latescibacterota bacterium]
MNGNAPRIDELSVVLCGEAGQGIQTVEFTLTALLKRCGYNFFSMKEYMSRVRGGSNSTEIRISTRKVNAFVRRIDILFPLTRDALLHVRDRITPDTLILGEKERLTKEGGVDTLEIMDVKFTDLAKEVGGTLYANTIAVGIIAGLLRLEREITDQYLGEYFGSKGEEVVKNNLNALSKGYEIGGKLRDERFRNLDIRKNPEIYDEIIVSGAEAIGMGALCGGCSFVSSYPMTPSTGILTFLSQQQFSFDIIAEQAEDEISAINMAIGAWYAGARGFVCTAGGGFALMVEGVSLAGMLESPMVISVGQRPAPATGLPTRTEQGDLQFVLHAGHGEFARALFAPGTLEDCFYLTRKAFDLADRYQIPVFVLSDQYIADCYYNFKKPDVSDSWLERHIVTTDHDYKRYQFTDSGISPRGIPGNGDGFVVLDSDEHTEEGHITEDFDIRTRMVEKRLKRLEFLRREAEQPELIGNKDCRLLAVCWGSNVNIAREAIAGTGRDDISLLYFKQVFPLPPNTADYFSGAKKKVIIENNATSQFGQVLLTEAGITMDEKILKYNGLPFSVEELTDELMAVAGREG